MAISEHPLTGTILIADFNQGFREPEMVKRRPVVVISPKISVRDRLCTVVAISSTPPRFKMPYHATIEIEPDLPPPWGGKESWIKGDMVYSVGFHRLDLVRLGKRNGKREYRYDTLPPEQMKLVRTCVLRGIGLNSLTKHL